MENSIFISIASYRDTELICTLHDLLKTATQPHLLHIVICYQNNGDITEFEQAGIILDSHSQCGEHPVYRARIQGAVLDVISMHYTISRGVGYARHLCELLYDNEAYFLQIDSHCRFVQGWDNEMMGILEDLKSESIQPLLSTYPPDYQPGTPETRDQFTSRLIFKEFMAEGFSMQTSICFKADRPLRNTYLAGGFIFADGHFVRNVPNDPQIIFSGEEIAMSVRAFTHGYDCYAPHKILLWHRYGRFDNPKVWNDHDTQAKQNGEISLTWEERGLLSRKRVQKLLGLESGNCVSIEGYGTGSKRTLEEFGYASGLSFQTRSVHPDVTGHQKCAYFDVKNIDKPAWLSTLVALSRDVEKV